MFQGEVILASLPQADGVWKRRPTVYLREMPPFEDFLVCGVSTQLRHEVSGFDEIISDADADFRASGLSEPSLIRLGYLSVVSRNDVLGSLGHISQSRHQRLLDRLSSYLIS